KWVVGGGGAVGGGMVAFVFGRDSGGIAFLGHPHVHVFQVFLGGFLTGGLNGLRHLRRYASFGTGRHFDRAVEGLDHDARDLLRIEEFGNGFFRLGALLLRDDFAFLLFLRASLGLVLLLWWLVVRRS